jgi:aryl-alcohol dehydrogenase-like predicted oxidoreductase
MQRRVILGGLIAGSAAILAGGSVRAALNRNMSAWMPQPAAAEGVQQVSGGMKYRALGASGVNVSEVGFGAWGIGGAYGSVDRAESLRTLARAEELGCNFVDTAMVYGDSELVLGEFLAGRRSKWLVATKYSGQPEGLEATLEKQLGRLRIDAVDLYQIHWAPSRSEQDLYAALYRLRKAGKARLVGISLYSIADINRVLKREQIDVIQLPFSLLDPDPFLAKLDLIRRKGVGVIIRSSLKEGFLTGKYRRDAVFPDPDDQRHHWTPEQIASTVDSVEQFRFIEAEAGSMAVGAACYPLCFAETSTVILGTKSTTQADSNFGRVSATRLSESSLQRIEFLQRSMGLHDRKGRIRDAFNFF